MFIHFFNDQILRLYGLDSRIPHSRLIHQLKRMLYCAIMFSGEPLTIPTVDLVQSPVIKYFLPSLRELDGVGLVDFVGSTNDIEELLSRKQVHFKGTGLHGEWSDPATTSAILPFAGSLSVRTRNTTLNMQQKWTSDVESLAGDREQREHSIRNSFGAQQLDQARRLLLSRSQRVKFFDSAIELPDRLGDHAFLWQVVKAVRAFPAWDDAMSRGSFEMALAHYWVKSHVDEYSTSIIGRDRGVGWIDCGLRWAENKTVLDMVALEQIIMQLGLQRILDVRDMDELLDLKFDTEAAIAISTIAAVWERTCFKDADADFELAQLKSVAAKAREAVRRARSWPHARQMIFSLIADGALDIVRQVEPVESKPRGLSLASHTRRSRVFIGHGKSLVWLQLRDFLRDRLLCDWEEFNRVPVAGLTVVDRISKMLDSSSFAFLILTAEDEAKDGSVQARQNVVHELGLFQGRLGFGRAIVLLEEGCSDFSNIAGLQTLQFPTGRISAVFEDVRVILEERLWRPQTWS